MEVCQLRVHVIVSDEQEKLPSDRLAPVLEAAVRSAIQVAKLPTGQDIEVSLVLVDDEAIHKMNRTYRGIDRPTDVLSFPMESEPILPGEPQAEQLLGDIVISLERAALQAEEYGHSLEREAAYLTVHGLLHLVGHDHETDAQKAQMRALEEEVLGLLELGDRAIGR